MDTYPHRVLKAVINRAIAEGNPVAENITILLTPQNIESYLDKGDLYVQMKNRRWWKLRRNGKTQRWKTRPDNFRIPIKFGLKECGAIEHSHFLPHGHMDTDNIRHVNDVPEGSRS